MLFFKLPFQENIFSVEENSKEKFVSFFSFDGLEKINFYGKIKQVLDEELLKNEVFSETLNPTSDNFEGETQEDYTKKLEKVISFIKDNQLKKIVISRRKIIDYHSVSLTKTFLNLCENYPNAFTYFFINNNECWIGAFSEVLGKFNKDNFEFQTMSLAGTLPVDEEWSNKEIEEQKPVSEYIKNILQKYSDDVAESETCDHISGNIKHLRTDFKAKINPEDLENLIYELHPTPAVCGIPKEFCKQTIEEFEKYPREFYAGFSKVETLEEINFYVNLRCGKFFKNSAHLFVGGGITKDSDPEKEWLETEMKSEAILKNIAF